MSRGYSCLIETLELRTLLSAATLATDEQNLADAIAKLGSDQKASAAALATDRSTIKTLKGTPDPAMETLLNKLQSDLDSKAQTLSDDRATTKTIVAVDQAAIAADQVRIRTDRKSPDLLDEDKIHLADDKQKLADDKLERKLTQRDHLRDAILTIQDDNSAISAERRTGASNPDLKAAEDQLLSDALLFKGQIFSDQNAIADDRAIVAQDKREPAVPSTDLTGHFSGTVTVSQGINIELGDYPATFDVTSQTATTIVGTLLVPGLNIDADGTFNGSIDSSGNFMFSSTTASLTISGKESADGQTLTGNGITFQFAGYDQLAGYQLHRMN